MHRYLPEPNISDQDAFALIKAIIPAAKKKFNINITVSNAMPENHGGAFNGQDVIMNQTFVSFATQYSAYALIHGGLGHTNQLCERDPLLMALYCNPKPTRSEKEIRDIKLLEARATVIGGEMLKLILPDYPFIQKLSEFSTYWFAQDWKQLEYYLETGRTPHYGQRQILEEKDKYTLPSASSVNFQKTFRSTGPVLDSWINFNIQPPPTDGFIPGAKAKSTL